jgi:hypothetical protein
MPGGSVTAPNLASRVPGFAQPRVSTLVRAIVEQPGAARRYMGPGILAACRKPEKEKESSGTSVTIEAIGAQ